MDRKTRLKDALNALNWSYGAGDIEEFDFENSRIICKLQYGKRVFHFRIVKNTVYFRGHQKRFA